MEISELIAAAYKEDLPNGDLTTDSLGVSNHFGKASLIAKEDIVMSGVDLFTQCLKHVDENLDIKFFFKDSEYILKGQTVAIIEGNLIAALKAERVALNFIGHLSGVATLTRCFVKAIEGTKCKILDTRKTTPLYRTLEKDAVKHGLGTNHRMNLSDAILIKENHIQVAGGLGSAIKKIKSNTKKPIEIEVKSLEEVEKVIKLGVNRIMLDNMDLEETEKALAVIPKSIETEASGNMTLDRVGDVAKLGVNYISVGAITHSAPCGDFSLLFEWN